jgi:hypothetical protein
MGQLQVCLSRTFWVGLSKFRRNLGQDPAPQIQWNVGRIIRQGICLCGAVDVLGVSLSRCRNPTLPNYQEPGVSFTGQVESASHLTRSLRLEALHYTRRFPLTDTRQALSQVEEDIQRHSSPLGSSALLAQAGTEVAPSKSHLQSANDACR